MKRTHICFLVVLYSIATAKCDDANGIFNSNQILARIGTNIPNSSVISQNVNFTISSNELVAAIETTNMPLARQLIMRKRLINTIDEYGGTPLEVAIAYGNFELCELMITNGAFVDVVDQDGGTAISQAENNPRIKPEVRKQIISLLEAASHNPKNLAANDPDYKIAKEKEDKKNELLEIEESLSLGANVNRQDKNGKTGLMDYAATGNIEACKLLIKHGAKVDIKDNKGLTAIDYAATQLEKPNDKLKADIISLLKASQ